MFLAQTDYSWIANQGLAVAILVSIGWAMYRGIQWTGTTIISPLKDAAIAHLETATKSMKDISTSMHSIDTKVDSIDEKTTKIIDSHEGFFAESLRDRELVHKRLERLESQHAESQ